MAIQTQINGLLGGFWLTQTHLKKIVILGTTGSGKTTFLTNLVGEFDGAEVKRKLVIEEAQVINTFSPLEWEHFEDSTTTISLNVKSVLFLTTRTNQFQFYPLEQNKLPISLEEMDNLYPTLIVDTAGQERFDFMQEIGLSGADGVFIFADGTNIASIERITNYIQMVRKEEQEKNKEIPIAIFVNKKDLESRGIYIGSSSLE
ncbi:MAG: hypothetical protein ACXAD7_11700, partial [Candidatus Kariarchaeaceae archaeon]